MLNKKQEIIGNLPIIQGKTHLCRNLAIVIFRFGLIVFFDQFCVSVLPKLLFNTKDLDVIPDILIKRVPVMVLMGGFASSSLDTYFR